MPVYFVAHRNGPVKIGYAKDVQKRIKTLQCGHPDTLTCQAAAPGGQKLEHEYHQRFAKYRRNGEWFTRGPEIVAEIHRLRQEYGFIE